MARSAAWLLVLAAAGCATPQPARLAAAGDRSCAAGATLESRAGREWWAEHRWRYSTDAAAAEAYRALADVPDPSPWPD
ncbi:hypothetical protein MRO55_25800, partial [Escherichia coli]|uniref:hypothetical protein n=1 Tax=Escherichia coli TaxID=562 RepID=UPI0021151AC0